MCFSATASFAVGAGLAVPGVYAIRQKRAKGMLLFACTPLLFSLHQTAEGFLWLSLKNPGFESWYSPALYFYSFVSQPVWPLWVPLAIWLMEPDRRMKRVLSWFLWLGIAASLYMLYCLLFFPISAAAEHGHIRYYREFPYLDILRPINFVTIAVTPFLSTLRYTKLLSVVMMAALIVAYFFYRNYFISVWCFFAAILSLLMILVIRSNSPKPGTDISG